MPKPITKAQRKALKRIYDRRPIWKDGTAAEIAMKHGWRYVKVSEMPLHYRPVVNPSISMVWIHGVHPTFLDADEVVATYKLSTRHTYREFRRTVAHGFDCLMVQWAGLTLGIEKDGYTHS